jgi:hypothetical protein
MSKPTIPEVIDRFVPYYRQHPAWGSLHIVLDDGNVGDDDVRYCIAHAEERGDVEGADLARVLLQMSKTQRWKLGDMVHRRAAVTVSGGER